MFFGRKFTGYHNEKLSGLDIFVLSVIKESKKAITGYDIIQATKKRFRGMWQTSAGTIYPLLKRLKEEELISVEVITEKNREKKVYTITERGIKELKHSVGAMDSSFHSIINFIKTVSKPFKIFQCFPFPEDPEECAFIHEDVEIEQDYTQLKLIIKKLKDAKKRNEKKIEEINQKIKHYEEILIKFEGKAKTIEIVEDDEEFENF